MTDDVKAALERYKAVRQSSPDGKLGMSDFESVGDLVTLADAFAAMHDKSMSDRCGELLAEMTAEIRMRLRKNIDKCAAV